MSKNILPEENKSFLLKSYREMLLLRRFEERAGQLYTTGEIAGFCHLYIGQEAVAIGIKQSLKQGDSMITSYRDHGIMLAMDCDPKSVMAELTGRATGCSKGKGGSMHMFDTKKGFYGGHGIVGAQIPLGTGLAFAAKYNNTDNVSIAITGDGGINQGQVYEAFNMAKLWNLPVLYVIENNKYAMGTSIERACSTTELYKRGASFDIPGENVDGMDFIAIYETAQKLITKIRNGAGPQILEVLTYRYRGHSMSDPAKYRTKEEVESYKILDPIDNLKQLMLKEKIAIEEDFKIIEKEIKDLMVEVVQFAQNSPLPEESELFTDIYLA